MLSIGLTVMETLEYNLKAGGFALENFYIFSVLLFKFYTRFSTHSVGVLYAFFYMNVLSYRKLKTLEDQKKQFPIIFFLHQARYFCYFCNVVAIVGILTILFGGHEAVADAYAWSTIQNCFFLALTRVGFSISTFILFTTMIIGHFNSGNRALRNDFFRAMGKLSFESALLHPIVIMFFYSSPENGTFLNFSIGFAIGMGNIFCTSLVSLVVYLTFEYTSSSLVAYFLDTKLSHKRLIRSHC